MPVDIKACREHCDPNNPAEVGVLENDIEELCDLVESQAQELELARATIAAIPVVTVVGGEACKECREHAVWEMELSAERLAALEALVSDLESPHPSAWYSRERILLKIKRMREELTKAANAAPTLTLQE